MSIGSGVLLSGVVEIPPFPILRPLAYTTGLGYRPTCDTIQNNKFIEIKWILTIEISFVESVLIEVEWTVLTSGHFTKWTTKCSPNHYWILTHIPVGRVVKKIWKPELQLRVASWAVTFKLLFLESGYNTHVQLLLNWNEQFTMDKSKRRILNL